MDLNTWFRTKYWLTYPADLCGSSSQKGSKTKAYEILEKKIKPNESKMESMLKVLQDQIAQTKQDQQKGIEVYRWPHMTRYLNDGRYKDEVESEQSQPIVKARICAKDGCSRETHGHDYRYCADHLPSNENPKVLEKMRKKYKDLGLIRKEGESVKDHAKRCREIALNNKPDLSMPDKFK